MIGSQQRAYKGLRTTAVVLCVSLTPSAAPAFDVPAPGNQGKDRISLDSTFDVGRGGSSLDLNATFALFGILEESGLRGRLTVSGSWYQFLLDPTLATLGSGRSLEGDVLAGY